MKKIYIELEAIKNKLETQIEDREIIHDDRSEAWQDSEKGLEYYQKTEDIQFAIDDILNAMDNLENLF